MSTFGLLRSNVKLTGNVKISVSSKDEIFLNSIDANKELSDGRFKRVVVNPKNKLSTDIYNFFDKGKLASNLIYDVLRATDDKTSKQDFSKHFEQQYNYGMGRCDSDLFDEAYCMFAPIWITKKIPNFFVVFRNPDARSIQYERNPDKLLIGKRYTVFGDENFSVGYGVNNYISGESFITDGTNGGTYTKTGTEGYVVLDDPNFELDSVTDPDKFIENFVSPSDIVAIFDLREGTNIGNYIRNHINDPLFSTKSLEVDFNNKQFIYNGIDLDTGVISSAAESIDTITEQELDIIDFDEFITQGFERHRLISSNLLNMEFLFHDNKSEDYTFNRYFGFYCDDEDIGSFFPDKPAMFSKQGLYRNIYHDKEFLPQYYGKKITDVDGIKIIPDEINSVDGYIFRKEEIKEKPTFYYLKDKRNGFHKFNNLATTEHYTLVDKEIDSELLFGVNDDHFELEASKFSEGGRASAVFTVNQQMTTGFSIQFFEGNTSLGYLIADHLPNVTIPELQLLEEGSYSGDTSTPYQEGESIEHFFYPTGTPEQIAQGMATAIDWLLKDKNIDATAIGNQVFLRAQFTGADYNQLRFVVINDNGEISTDNNRLTGGTTTTISRARVDKDLPVDVTEDSFIATEDGGFIQIASISSYLEEPILENGIVVGFKNLNTYKVITIVDENKEIKIKKGDVFIHNEIPLKMGVFSFYNLKDFDFDSFTTDYATDYSNEYSKYFKTSGSELDIGDAYVVHKLEVDQIKPTIEHNGINHTSTGYDIVGVNTGLGQITIAGNVVNDFSGDKIVIRDSTGNDGVYIVGSVVFGAGTVITVFGTIPDGTIDGIVHSAFTAVNEDFIVTNGDPIVINEKYYNDEELKKFIGFNALNTGEISAFESSSIDPDDLVNKFAILSFDETRVEYNRLRENKKSKNVLKSKIVPTINKWVLENGNNIRDVEYRLNSSDAFGELNFSPSFVDEDQNPEFFTHEWLYLGAVPENASDEDLFNSSSYFGNKFDKDKYLDIINDYFLNYFTIDDYIRRLPIAESTAQSEKWTLSGTTGGTIIMQIQGIFFSEPFSVGFPQTVTNWFASHSAAVNALGINVVDDLSGGLTFTAVEAGVPFNVFGFAAGANGLWTKSNVVKNIGNRLLEAPTDSRFTTFSQVGDRKYQTFFRGVRVNLDSEQIDYTGYKFSAILNFKKTSFLEKQPPFEIEVIENRDFKNITFLVTIVVDDYKIVPDLGVGKEPYGEYLYLYIMESLKRYANDKYEFGQLFEYPLNAAVGYYNSGVNGDPLGNPTAPPVGAPITSFRGIQLYHDLDMSNLPNSDTLKFDNSRFLLTDFFKLRENGLFGRIIALDDAGATMVSSTNPFHSPTQYVLDRPSTILGIGDQENYIQLKNTGWSIVQIPFLTAVAQYTASGVHSGIYPMEDMVFFEEGGGKSVYDKIASLLSFGSMLDIVNDNDDRHISYKLIQDGILTDNNTDFKLSFIKPSVIKRDNALSVTELNITRPELPNENVVDYEGTSFSKNVTHHRYGGNFIPKFKDVLFFKNDKLQMAWGLNDTTWEQSDHDWTEFDVHNPEVKTIPFSRRLFGLNTKFDTTIKGFGIIKNHYHHKVSSTNADLLLLDNPIYPSVDEVAIDKTDYNIFLSDFDSSFYKDYSNKNSFNKIFGYFNTGDEKSYLGTKLAQLEEKIILFDFKDISEDTGIDDPSFDLEGRELVYEKRDNFIFFRISMRKTITEYIQNKLIDEFKKYVNEFNTFGGTFDKAIRDYVEGNITELYKITDIKSFVKKYNEEENVPLVSVEPNSLLLIQQGYKEDKNISTTNIDDLEIVLKYNANIEFQHSFNLRFQVEK